MAAKTKTQKAAPAEKKKKPGPHARKKAREAAQTPPAPLKEREPKPDKPPRLVPFVERPFSEEAHVPLSPQDFTNKTHVMLKMYRERENLEAEFERVKAGYKERLKAKDEEITELQAELQSGTEKRVVPLIARYYLKEQRKVILSASKPRKKVREEPMTPAEIKEVSASQPALLAVPAGPVNGNGHQGALNMAMPKEGEKPADPDRTNPTEVSGVNVELPLEGFADSETVFGSPRPGVNIVDEDEEPEHRSGEGQPRHQSED